MGLHALVGLVDARAFRGLVARFRCTVVMWFGRPWLGGWVLRYYGFGGFDGDAFWFGWVRGG